MRWQPARLFIVAGAACALLLVLAVVALLRREHSPVLPVPVDMPEAGAKQVRFPPDFGSLAGLVPFAGGISPVPTDVSPPAEHAPEFRDAAWVRAQNPDSFTLQVFAARDEESVKRFLAGRDDRNAFVYFLHPQEGADWYVVVTGSFATRELAAGLTVTALLAHLGIDTRKVAVERNLEIVPKSAFATTEVMDGDRLEIVHFIGGG